MLWVWCKHRHRQAYWPVAGESMVRRERRDRGWLMILLNHPPSLRFWDSGTRRHHCAACCTDVAGEANRVEGAKSEKREMKGREQGGSRAKVVALSVILSPAGVTLAQRRGP